MVIAAALSLMDLPAAAPLLRGSAARALTLSLVATVGVVFLGVLQGILVAIVAVDPPLLPPQLVAARRGARAGRRARRLAQRRRLRPTPSEVPGIVVYRWEAPLFFANAGLFRRQVRSLVREQAGPLGRAAVRGGDRRRRHRRGDARAARQASSTSEGVHLAFVELRNRLQDLILRYGLFETLDRDHFYPSIEEAIAAIAASDAADGGAGPPRGDGQGGGPG